jgi:3',5'-cyclic-AMP phosphodiesterase
VRLAQVSDTHLLRDRDGWRWGQHPAANLSAVMAAIPAVDVIVLTGDIADDGTAEAYRLADSLTSRRDTRRYVVPGNHDDPETMARVFGPVEGIRVASLSNSWSLVLVNSQAVGHDRGHIPDRTRRALVATLDRLDAHAVLCMHHPPVSPCPEPDCGLHDAARLLAILQGSRVRVVLSGHVHQAFEVARDGIVFLGAPSTLSQLRHGGDPHYIATDEPPAAQVVDLHDDGRATRHIVAVR